MKDTNRDPRSCGYCGADVPPNRDKWCSPRCSNNGSRVASYQRKTPEERAEINKRSNDRRYQKDLKPKIDDIVAFSEEITPGGPIARYVVGALYVQSIKDWKLRHALHYGMVREALADMAGGWDELTEIETTVEERMIEVMSMAHNRESEREQTSADFE